MRPAGETVCCTDRALVWLIDDVMTVGLHGGTIGTAVIDQLPPWRARLYVTVAVQANAQLEQGSLADLRTAAAACPPGQTAGWWSSYLSSRPVTPTAGRAGNTPRMFDRP